MITPVEVLERLRLGRRIGGRHLIVSAHPDDETISGSALLGCLTDVLVLQLTNGVPAQDPGDRVTKIAERFAERRAAFAAAGWHAPIVDAHVDGRVAHQALAHLLVALRTFLVGIDMVWTHPYEGGHLDHDSAAWLVQVAAGGATRMEFASYYAHAFGRFWPDATVPTVAVRLTPALLTRKRAALAAYASQAHILRKFPDLGAEPYRVAPTYDFTRPAPPPACRWDRKGYRPTTASWRETVADASRQP